MLFRMVLVVGCVGGREKRECVAGMDDCDDSLAARDGEGSTLFTPEVSKENGNIQSC